MNELREKINKALDNDYEVFQQHCEDEGIQWDPDVTVDAILDAVIAALPEQKRDDDDNVLVNALHTGYELGVGSVKDILQAAKESK